MKPGESAKTLQKFAKADGVDLPRRTPRHGIAQMPAFFRRVKPVGCGDGDSQPALSQLRLTWRFQPMPELDAIEAGNCGHDNPVSEDRFLKFIDESMAPKLLGDRIAASVDLRHERA